LSRRDQVVFVDEPTQDVAASKALNRRRGRRLHRRIVRCSKTQTAMRPVAVVVIHVDLQHSFDVGPMEEEKVIKTFAAHGPDPTLREGVRHGRAHRCADDLGADRSPDVVE
jgi:hypothetical protein